MSGITFVPPAKRLGAPAMAPLKWRWGVSSVRDPE